MAIMQFDEKPNDTFQLPANIQAWLRSAQKKEKNTLSILKIIHINFSGAIFKVKQLFVGTKKYGIEK